MGNLSEYQNLTRGLVPDALAKDLSNYTLGSFHDRRHGLKRIALGDADFSVTAELNPRGDPRTLYVHTKKGEQLLGVTLHGRHDWQTVCGILLSCCEKRSTQPLQRYLQHRELQEVLRVARTPSKMIIGEGRQQLLDCQQFAGIPVPELGEFNARLAALPFMNFHDFIGVADPTQGSRSPALIRSGAVLGTVTDRSWHLVDRGNDYIHGIAVSMIENGTPWHSAANPIQIADFFGVGFVWGGRERCAAVKGMNNPALTIRADLIQLGLPVKIMAKTEADVQMIEERIGAGLFSAQPIAQTRKSPGQPHEMCGTWAVEKFEGPWVFSRDLERARSLYEQFVAAPPAR